MTYKALCNVTGEPKPRQISGNHYRPISLWVSQTLADSSVPIGTVVEVYEVREVLVRAFEKKDKSLCAQCGGMGRVADMKCGGCEGTGKVVTEAATA